MSAALAFAPASGSIYAVKTAVRVTVSGVPSNDATAYDETKVPTEPQLKYYIKATKSGQPTLVSHTFSTSASGGHVWDNVIFPSDGTWAVTLCYSSDDSTVVSANVVVAA